MNRVIKISGIATLLLMSNMAFSQSDSSSISQQDILTWMVFAVAGVCVLAIVYLIMALNLFLKEVRVKLFDLGGLFKSMTKSVPVENEEEIMTSHVYDGIRELDNRLPPWWVAMFYVTIVFSVGYIGYYHVFDMGKLQNEEYEYELQLAALEHEKRLEASGGVEITAENVEILESEEELLKGKEIFENFCTPCHLDQGKGGPLAPNLTDEHWKNGSTAGDLFTVIKDGKGSMPAWGTSLSPEKIQQVTSYIKNLDYVAPPDGKGPEGEKTE